MSVPPPPSSSPFNSISSPRRYLRSRTRTSSIDFVPQSAVAGPARSPVGASSAPPAIANASPPLPPANTSPTRPLIPSYDPNNVPYTPPYGLGSGGPVSFPPTSPPMSVATGYTPTSPLALESPSSPSIGRPSSRVRPVSFGLPARSEDQGSPYSPLVQPDYVPREENSSQVPLQRGPFEPPPPVPRTQNRKFSTSSAGSQIGAPRDADESASGRPLSPQSSAGVSPVRRQTSFHIPAPPSIVPGKGAAGGVAQFSLGLGPRPQSQSQVESPRAPVPNLFRPVTSTMAALGLGEARTRKDADIPSKPSISTSNSTRTNPPDNAVTWKENPLVSNGLGLKTQSPGTVLFQTAHGLVDTLLPGITSPFHDESNRSETKEPPTLNDSPSSISLTVLSSPVISSSVALDKVEPTLPEEVLPEISRNDNAGPAQSPQSKNRMIRRRILRANTFQRL
ncbi:hypothetical protein BS47DRAFT_1055596 [Hydnum rufescens UP504]|uniref:Uncharacterized protein n=1 Tax=Hydnum rufescens UP504 TaxID=1448309 RepID=A0A9P6DSV7_9AGAM|nr:hypothetical protein BS47DRAFT_1055596 [Hydnum rufescens UP504]